MKPIFALLLILIAVLFVPACESFSASAIRIGYGLPNDGGNIEVTLFPDKLWKTGKRVIPTGK